MAIHILAKIDDRLHEIADKQAPFITSLALNKASIGARDVVKGNLPTRFRLRNNWTMRGIQSRMSNKANLVAEVQAPGYMGIQEEGGTREPDSGFRMLAAPGKALQGNRIIPKKKRPGAVLADKAFIIGMPNESAGVFIRYGKKRGQIRLLWWLQADQQYEERFQFEQDVNDYVQDRFSSIFLSEWSKVIGEGGYAASASRGRKRIDRPTGMSLRAFKRQQRRLGL
ncbi:MAG: hypothetical protein ABFD94_04215 [Armatimonadia bacterium]